MNNTPKQNEKVGKNVRILLLTNPNDPLGVVYSTKVVDNVVTWAIGHGMHTIVDEIYALSDRMPPNHPNHFHSVLNTLTTPTSPHYHSPSVHFLYSLSKDFGASGFRFGILYTHSKPLLLALANLNIFSGVSHPIQAVIASVLRDREFVEMFLEEGRRVLERSWRVCVDGLEEMVVGYYGGRAGLSVYADFSGVVPAPVDGKVGGGGATMEGERRFAQVVWDEAGVVLTPGESMGDGRPGWFRICYACVEPEVLGVAMERISCLLLRVRVVGWDGYRVGVWREEVLKSGAALSSHRHIP